MDNEFIEAGKIVNTHGIRGEVKIQPWADSPGFLTSFEYIYIDQTPVKIISARVHKGCVIATLDGVNDIDAAIRMKNKIISVKKKDAKLEDDRHFIADLIGLQAIDFDTGEELGAVKEILTLPSNDVYVIKGQREVMVPAVPEFIIEKNIKEGFVKVKLIEGM